MGGFGRDMLLAQGGPDSVVGGPGDDVAFGGNGRDSIYGGSGDDVLSGDSAVDELYGGKQLQMRLQLKRTLLIFMLNIVIFKIYRESK